MFFIASALTLAACRQSSAPAPEPVAVPATPVAQLQSVPDIPPTPVAPESPHTEPSAACLAKTANATGKPALAIHRWVDSAGITHYSDQAPTTAVSAYRVLEVKDVPPVSVSAVGYDVNLPSDLQQRAIVDAIAVQRALRDVLGVGGSADAELKIVFVRAADAYAKLVGDGALAASAGAYVPPQRTIYVRMQATDEASFAVLRHEITHALVHELIGNLPIALNEGLAEYFRRYRAAGLGGQVDIAADRNALTAAAPKGDGTDALVELLAFSGSDFYTADRDRRYVEAYALAAVLMQTPQGIAALHEVLKQQQADPCEPVSVERLLDQRYPGGLGALAADWAAFLRSPPAMVRTY